MNSTIDSGVSPRGCGHARANGERGSLYVVVMRAIDGATWEEVGRRPRTFLAVPLGSLEQHGPHLPLGTDTRVAIALADALAERRSAVLVTPPVAIGASGEHAGFAGTLSIGTEVLCSVIVELVRSADWASGVLLVNGHGGNSAAVRAALATLRNEGRNALAWWPEPANDPRSDAHAGWLETSVMLHLEPRLVRPERAVAGDRRPIGELLPALRQAGVQGVAPNGVLGDPTGACAEDGERIVATWVADLVAHFDAWAS